MENIEKITNAEPNLPPMIEREPKLVKLNYYPLQVEVMKLWMVKMDDVDLADAEVKGLAAMEWATSDLREKYQQYADSHPDELVDINDTGEIGTLLRKVIDFQLPPTKH